MPVALYLRYAPLFEIRSAEKNTVSGAWMIVFSRSSLFCSADRRCTVGRTGDRIVDAPSANYSSAHRWRVSRFIRSTPRRAASMFTSDGDNVYSRGNA